MNDKFYAAFRDGSRTYTSRPPANCRSARVAWDRFAEGGEIEWLHLLDGFWGCGRPGTLLVDEVDAPIITRLARQPVSAPPCPDPAPAAPSPRPAPPSPDSGPPGELGTAAEGGR